MKEYGCSYCQDLRNIEPASYVSSDDKNLKELIMKARAEKKFLHHFSVDGEKYIQVVDQCPVCGYQFTPEDYASYE